MMRTKTIIFLTLCLIMLLIGCGKDFLELKRNADQVVPSKISDYQALLDNGTVMNMKTSLELAIVGTDEYILSDEDWNSIDPFYSIIKNGYIWSDNVYEGKEVNDWNNAYERILYANMALEVEKISPSDSERNFWNNVRGQALFHRAFTLYQLAQIFCNPYDPKTALNEEGIPIRMDYDISIDYKKGSLKDVYDIVLDDLKTAIDLLPVRQSSNYRPSKIAVLSLLARIYREMELWDEAFDCAEKVLVEKKDLLDYNEYVGKGTYPFMELNNGIDNKEIIFYCLTGSGAISTKGKLSNSWKNEVFNDEDDLRNVIYFNEDGLFYGSYSPGNYFTGLAVDEVLLIRAECYARKNAIELAETDLNYLLKNRYSNKSFKSINGADRTSLLGLIEKERKKELYMRGLRWSDIRRQNLNVGSGITLTRKINGITYRLRPNDKKWTWPFPDKEAKTF